MLTLTRQGLLLSLSATVIPSQGSSDVPVAVVNDINTYVGYTLEPRVGYYLNGIYKSIVCTYDTSAKTFSVPAEAFKQIGIIDITLALIDNANANHIETCQTVHATVNKAPLGTVVLPDQTTWQDYVNSYMNQLFDSNYKPQFDQIQQDLENLVTEAQQQQQTAEQQQTQIDNAISIMGEYQIVSNDPVQIQFKKGDGTYGPTVDLGDGLASKSMVNAGYYQSIGSQYSGSASDYGIEVEEIVGAYSQGLNPSPDNPQEMQAVEISELKSCGRNLFSGLIKGSGINSTTGAEQVSNVSACSDYIPVKAGQEYYISGLSNTINSFVAAYDYEKKFIGRTSGAVASGRALNNTTLLSAIGTGEIEKLAYLRVTQYVSIGNSGTIDDVDGLEIMLNVGDTAEPYTPYTGADTVTLDEPLVLRALPNGVADTYEDGVITRRVGVVEFDGSADENWKIQQTPNPNVASFFINFSNNKLLGYTGMLCDKLTPNVSGLNNTSNVNVCSFNSTNGSNLIMDVANEIATTVEDWKTWLQSNPITVWHELATPTTEAFEIDTLQSWYPYTNAWCDSVVQPQQIAWNVLTGKSSILDGNGNLIQQGYMTPQDNLLINSDFRYGIINQKGQSIYNGQSTWLYGIDMWRAVDITIDTQFKGQLTISGNGYLVQLIDLSIDTYTLTFKIKNINKGNINVYLEQTEPVHKETISSVGLHSFVYKITKNAKGVGIKLNNFSGDIEFIKLEKGNQFTGMPVWNYALEYLKCCRYIYVWYLPEIPSHGYNDINNLSFFTGTAFPVPFASTPTWTVKQLLMDKVDVSSDLNTINVTPNRCTSISLTGQISTISGTIIFSSEPS